MVSSKVQNQPIPKGYKQTEVGVIPDDWEVGKLDNYYKTVDCKHITATFTTTGYPLASIQEVQSRILDLANAKKTNYNFYLKLIEAGRKPEAGDLILSRNATVGEMAKVTNAHPEFAMGQDVCLLKKRNNNYSTDFLQELFSSGIIKKQLSEILVGSTFKRINIKQIKAFIVAFPNSMEQEAIASALTDMDSLIESLEKLIEKKRNIKQGTMQELLTGKTRLPGFENKKGYKQTEVGVIPADWEVKRLGDIIVSMQNGVFYKPSSKGKGIRLINVGDLYKTTPISIDELELFDASEDEKRRYKVKNNDMFFTRSSVVPSGIAFCNIYCSNNNQEVVFDSHVIKISPNVGEIFPMFLYLYNVSAIARKYLVANAKRAIMTTIDQPVIKKLPIPLPPTMEEQEAIASALTTMDHEIEELETRLKKTRAVKSGMMQDLLTGRVRLV